MNTILYIGYVDMDHNNLHAVVIAETLEELRKASIVWRSRETFTLGNGCTQEFKTKNFEIQIEKNVITDGVIERFNLEEKL